MSETNNYKKPNCGLIACVTCDKVNNCSAVTKKDVELMGIPVLESELRDPTGKEMDEFYQKNSPISTQGLINFALNQGQHSQNHKAPVDVHYMDSQEAEVTAVESEDWESVTAQIQELGETLEYLKEDLALTDESVFDTIPSTIHGHMDSIRENRDRINALKDKERQLKGVIQNLLHDYAKLHEEVQGLKQERKVSSLPTKSTHGVIFMGETFFELWEASEIKEWLVELTQSNPKVTMTQTPLNRVIRINTGLANYTIIPIIKE